MSQGVNASTGQAKVLAVRLPLQGKTLLLPYSMVAEVASLSLRTQDGAFLGSVEWRGVRIPVFSLERACGQNLDIIAGRVRLAVIYGLTDPTKRPYYALVLAGMPHTESIMPTQLTTPEETGAEDACALLGLPALLGDEIVFMPNIQDLEAWMDSVEMLA
jgi:chemotaxis signal transduction protein